LSKQNFYWNVVLMASENFGTSLKSILPLFHKGINRIVWVCRQTGKGANRVLFFGAGNGFVQMAKNKHGCLFRTPFLWFVSFGGAKEMNIDFMFQDGAPL
jgi:hypothetical protein